MCVCVQFYKQERKESLEKINQTQTHEEGFSLARSVSLSMVLTVSKVTKWDMCIDCVKNCILQHLILTFSVFIFILNIKQQKLNISDGNDLVNDELAV